MGICLRLLVFQAELELLQSHGIPSEDIIYSGVCKQVSQIKYAAKNGIDLLVCDNEAELRKISRCHPNAKYVFNYLKLSSFELKAAVCILH